mgnify:CR=1 FL=1
MTKELIKQVITSIATDNINEAESLLKDIVTSKMRDMLNEAPAKVWNHDEIIKQIMHELDNLSEIKQPYKMDDHHGLWHPVTCETDIEDNAAHIESPAYDDNENDRLKADEKIVGKMLDKLFKSKDGVWRAKCSSGKYQIYLSMGSNGSHNGIVISVEYHMPKRDWDRDD